MNDDDKYDDLIVTLGNGFKTNDGTEVSSFAFTPDGQGNAYIYGTWEDNTHLDIESQLSGDPSADALYVVTQASQQINGASTNGKAYATAFIPGQAEIWVVNNLDHTTSPISDWSDYTSYANLKVIGTWNSEKAPVLKRVHDSTDDSYTIAPFTRIDLSSVTGLTTIPEEFFNGNSSVKQVDLPETITGIGNSAFAYCTSLNTLNLPDGITTFGNSAFAYCTSLNTLNLPDGITTFGNSAFLSCRLLTIDKLPQSTTTIDTYAFYQCIIAFSTMPNVTSIGVATFYSCTFTSDASFEWSKTISSIPKSTFASSTLKSITIPENVTNIESYAFNGCKKLTTIIFKGGTAPTIGENAFYNTTSNNITIYVPKGSKSSYVDNGWSDVGTIVEQ
jgi:hypothetical protein